MNNSASLQLHVCSDASEFAYDAVVYILVGNVNNKLVSFVAGKSRGISEKHKHWSVPRKEIITSVTGINIILSCVDAFCNNLQVN